MAKTKAPTGAAKAPTPEQLKAARRAGFKGKKPKKPKTKTMAALEAWLSRYNAWCKAVRDASAQDAKNQAAEQKRKKLAQAISGL
jgi:hypothetical protein